MCGLTTGAVRAMVFFGLSGFLGWGLEGTAEASPFCPSSVTAPVILLDEFGNPTGTTTITIGGIGAANGTCTNSGSGIVDPTAFSGAALASQALSDLTQTTTQETSRNTINKMTERREEEENRCPAGFKRVDGECERIPVVQPEEAAAVEEAAPPPPPPPKKGKKAKAIAPERGVAPAPKAVRVVRPLPPPPPPPVEPPVRFGTWTQVIGDYEHRDASSSAFVFADTGAFAPLGIGVQSNNGTIGFEIGTDITTRGILFPGDGLIAGLLSGFVSSRLTLNTTSTSFAPSLVGNGSAQMHANLSGPLAGAYATYFNGGFSADILLKADVFNLNENFTDNLAFTGGGGVVTPLGSGVLQAFNAVTTGSGSTSLLAATVFGDLNYRFNLYPGYWIEPTVGAQYTNTSYGGGAADLGLQDGTLVMVQGGARLGAEYFFANGIHATTTLTGLAYSDILVSGGFIPGAGFLGNNILAQSDQGQVRGRGVVTVNCDLGQGLSTFVLGDVRGGQGLFGAGGKAGIRYVW